MSIYDFKVIDQDKKEVSLSDYKDKVLLIVNTATRCGFTKQYSELEQIYQMFKDNGFEILDFPCNQFLMQAPGDDEKIHSFCVSKFNISFKQFTKIKVNGKEAIPLYNYLKEKSGGARIKWNFTKFLIGRDGEVKERFEPSKTPLSISEEIKKYL